MDSDDRNELAAQLFALLTGTLEDAAAVAAEGQGGGRSVDHRMGLVSQIREVGNAAVTLASTIGIVLSR